MTRARSARKSNLVDRPIVTLTSDFGLSDSYVAAMKAVLIRHCPQVRLIDVTHCVPRHDILCGSITLERAIDGFPVGTVHLAVVDPGVGSDRRLIVAELNRQYVICPDNGLVTWSWRRHNSAAAAHEITWRPDKFSDTFHGRDILAPVAGRLAGGENLKKLARPIHNPILLDITPADIGKRSATVIHIDHFGNATTNLSVESLGRGKAALIRVKGHDLGRIKRTYWDVPPGKPLALIGSSGLLEIAVRDGDASKQLKLKVGDEVRLQ